MIWCVNNGETEWPDSADTKAVARHTRWSPVMRPSHMGCQTGAGLIKILLHEMCVIHGAWMEE